MPQRRALGAAHGVEVGVDVGTAEAVDRLLRVADGDQPVTGEGALEDLPLQPVGVLELVDEDQPVALGELLGELDAVARVGEGRREVADEAVVADLPARPLAPLDLGDGVGDAFRPAPARPADRR